MLLVLIALVLLGLFLWCYSTSSIDHIRIRDIACSQVCDINNPGTLTICSTGQGSQAREACRVYYSCVKDCRTKQAQQIKEESPDEGWGSRYSRLNEGFCPCV